MGNKIMRILDTVALSLQDATAKRLFAVALVVALIPVGTYFVRAGMKPSEVRFPDHDLRLLPMQLGPWKGEERQLDPDIFTATGAKYIVERSYEDNTGRSMSLHIAVFGDPDEGIYHRPYNCYRGHGYTLVSEQDVPLQVPTRENMMAHVMTWEKERRKVVVAYWYQLGDHLLFDRNDMTRVRFAMMGQHTWPALIKVMIETPATAEAEETERQLQDFAARVCQWIDVPEDGAASTPAPSE